VRYFCIFITVFLYFFYICGIFLNSDFKYKFSPSVLA